MLSDAEVNKICDRLMELPMSEWGDMFDLSSSDCSKVVRECDHRAGYYAAMSGYFAARGGNGCGDHGHVEAYKVGRVRRVKVRKTLGYSE